MNYERDLNILLILAVVASLMTGAFIAQNIFICKAQSDWADSIVGAPPIQFRSSDATDQISHAAIPAVTHLQVKDEFKSANYASLHVAETDSTTAVVSYRDEINTNASIEKLLVEQDAQVATAQWSSLHSDMMESMDVEANSVTSDMQSGHALGDEYSGTLNIARNQDDIGGVLLASPKNPYPDLEVTAATYAARLYMHGEIITATVTATNSGTAAATETIVMQIALSTDRSWENGNDYLITTVFIEGLELETSLVVPVAGLISALMPEGFYYLGVRIDTANDVQELRENNNTFWSSSANVEVRAPQAQWVLEPPSAVHATGNTENGSFTVNDELELNLPWNASVRPASAGWIALESSYTSGVGSGAQVRYTIAMNDTGNNRTGWIDVEDALFTVVQNAHPPLAPICIHPLDGQDDVERNLTLVWADGGYSSNYEVLFGTDTSPLSSVGMMISNGSTNEFQTGIRDAETPYRWQIIASNEGGSTTGAVWRFSTEAIPTIEDATDNRLSWSVYGDVPWFSQIITTHDGDDAMRSGAIGHNQSSILETTVEGPGSLSFWWKSDTEKEKDAAEFYMGNNMRSTISGDSNWVQESFDVPFGTHKLQWIYRKDATGSAGEDCCWLDEVSWDPGTVFTFPLSGYGNQWVAAYLWDQSNRAWIFLQQTQGPIEIVVNNVKPDVDRWYWLCVMVYNAEADEWELDHGSWLNLYDQW